MKVIGIDIGGTMIKYGLLSTKGEILDKGEIETEASKGIETLLKKIDMIVNLYKKYKLLGIAVSGTGQIDGKIGKVIGGNDIIPGWIGCELVEILEKKYKIPAVLENDVNCALLGEKWLGEGKRYENFISLTIGTGIGGAIFLNGRLFRGENGVAGEFGHIQIEKNGKKCLCGRRGCYEKYASTTALIKKVEKETGKLLNGKEIFLKESLGDIKIKQIIEEWIDYLTDGLSSIIYIFNPSLLVIGGGVTKQGEPLLNRIKESLYKKIGENYKKNISLKFSKLGNDSGMIGAVYLLIKKCSREQK